MLCGTEKLCLLLLEIANDDDGNDRDIYLYTKLQLSQYFAYSRSRI